MSKTHHFVCTSPMKLTVKYAIFCSNTWQWSTWLKTPILESDFKKKTTTKNTKPPKHPLPDMLFCCHCSGALCHSNRALWLLTTWLSLLARQQTSGKQPVLVDTGTCPCFSYNQRLINPLIHDLFSDARSSSYLFLLHTPIRCHHGTVVMLFVKTKIKQRWKRKTYFRRRASLMIRCSLIWQ